MMEAQYKTAGIPTEFCTNKSSVQFLSSVSHTNTCCADEIKGLESKENMHIAMRGRNSNKNVDIFCIFNMMHYKIMKIILSVCHMLNLQHLRYQT